jgi:hypothetical protein
MTTPKPCHFCGKPLSSFVIHVDKQPMCGPCVLSGKLRDRLHEANQERAVQ